MLEEIIKEKDVEEVSWFISSSRLDGLQDAINEANSASDEGIIKLFGKFGTEESFKQLINEWPYSEISWQEWFWLMPEYQVESLDGNYRHIFTIDAEDNEDSHPLPIKWLPSFFKYLGAKEFGIPQIEGFDESFDSTDDLQLVGPDVYLENTDELFIEAINSIELSDIKAISDPFGAVQEIQDAIAQRNGGKVPMEYEFVSQGYISCLIRKPIEIWKCHCGSGKPYGDCHNDSDNFSKFDDLMDW